MCGFLITGIGQPLEHKDVFEHLDSEAQTMVGATVHTLRLPYDRSSASVARHLLREQLHEESVPAPLIEDALLVVSELVSNAVVHGAPLPASAGAACDSIEFAWEVDPGDGVRVCVRDGGPPGPGGPVGPRVVRPDALSGRGLTIVEQVAAEWGVIRGQAASTVWARVGSV